MPTQPTGTVTFLFTDIEGSTKLWERYPEGMKQSLAKHDALLRRTIEDQGGYVFKTVGDEFCCAFGTAPDALSAAMEVQRSLPAEKWGETGPLKVRVALHTGAAEEREGDYFGSPVNRVARLLSAGHGGQVLLSHTTFDLVRDEFAEGTRLVELGEHCLQDLSRPEGICQLTAPGLDGEFASFETLDNWPNNLPLQPTAYIGRQKRLRSVGLFS